MIFLDHLLSATKGILRYPGKQSHFDAFSHDTRQLIPGELFVAVRGERSDGHDYLFEAVRRGASGLFAEARYINSLSEEAQTTLEQAGIATLVVEDTRIALQEYARFILERWHPIVIAVTGSTGKTSTKEAIAAVLSSNFATFKSWQNYNDLLGLPLSLGRLQERHEYAVLEFACDHPGEIRDLCRITTPQIGVFTNISPAQLQYFGTVKRLADEFGTLFTYLSKNGMAIINGDEGSNEWFHSKSWADRPRPSMVGTAPPGEDEAPLAGILSGGQVTLGNTAPIYLFAPSIVREANVTWQGVSCELPHVGPSAQRSAARFNPSWPPPIDRPLRAFPTIHLSSHLLGAHNISTMLAAYTVGQQCGIRSADIQHALANLQPLPGRLNPIAGVEGAMLLDDTHNATPASVIAGLETLKALPASRRIAVLGDMLRLGAYEEEAHYLIGQQAAQCVDYLVIRGEHAVIVAGAAQQAGLSTEKISITSTHEDAAQATRAFIGSPPSLRVSDGTSPSSIQRRGRFIAPTADLSAPVVLIKGSEETRMERVTELLMAEPSQAREQLVRQTPGWKQIVVMRPERPTWVEIDLSAIANNTRQVKTLIGPHVRVLASLKADAYGHGAVKVARTVLHNGASMLGVATVSEATPLREAGISAPILVFGYVPPWQMREAVRLGLTVTLYSVESAQPLSRAALALGRIMKVHVKVDSGMGRLGIRAEAIDGILKLVQEILHLPGLELEGIFTHFAMADAQDLTHARLQLVRFQHILQVLEKAGIRPPLVHTANSAATINMPEAHFDMVRPGIALYGLDPSPEVRLPEGFRPALSFKTQVSQVKMIPQGECISYGCTYITERPTLVAVLPVGYADGFRRAPSNWGSVLIHGQEAPLLGRVCMDQCIVDVTHIPQTRVGDEVVLIGRQGTATLSAEQVAQRLATSNYEVVSEILARVPRVD